MKYKINEERFMETVADLAGDIESGCCDASAVIGKTHDGSVLVLKLYSSGEAFDEDFIDASGKLTQTTYVSVTHD